MSPLTHSWSESRAPDTTYTPVRVYVWELPVRASHWFIVVSVAILSFTGYYIHNPFIISRSRTAYLMGTIRFIHLLAAFVFIAAFLLRFYWFFVGNDCPIDALLYPFIAGNGAEWAAWFPITRSSAGTSRTTWATMHSPP